MLGQRKDSPNYGRGVATLEGVEFVDGHEITSLLRDVFEDPNYRAPTAPTTALELMELTHKPNLDFGHISAVVEHDPMLAGHVLRVAQSPLYCGRGQLRSMRDVVVRLGLDNLIQVVFEVSMNTRVFKSSCYQELMDKVYQHGLLTAHIAKTICNYTSLYGAQAHLCGLLHDIGIAGALVALHEEGKHLSIDEIASAIDEVHEQGAGVIARHWGLPKEIELVIAHHHHVRIQGYAHPMAATICLAEALAHHLGAALPPRLDRTAEVVLEMAIETLQLDDAKMRLIRRDAEDVAEQVLATGP